MPPAPRFISGATYFDLSGYTYDAFTKELSCLHATLQKQASGNLTKELLHFEGQVWWYLVDSAGSTIKSWEHDGVCNMWVCIENSAVYDEMINVVCNVYSDDNVALLITNNLELIANHGILSPLRYRHHRVSQSDRLSPTETSIPVFPVLFTIKRAPNVHFPEMLSLRRKPLVIQPRNVHLPTMLSLQGKPLVVKPQTVYLPELVSLRRKLLVIQFPRQRRPRLSRPQIRQEKQGSSISAKQSSVRTRKLEPDFLISRRASDIKRRYSLPFDRFVTGLDGGARRNEWLNEALSNDPSQEIHQRKNRFLRTSARFPGKISPRSKSSSPDFRSALTPKMRDAREGQR